MPRAHQTIRCFTPVNMKTTFLLALVFTSGVSAAQIKNTNFELVDRHARSVKAKSATELVKKLTEPYNTEIEKIRAVFIWITQNIRYDIKGAANANNIYDGLLRRKISPIDSIVEKDYNDRIIQKILDEKQAICDGYSRLFKTLCDMVGIKAVIITGTIRWYTDPVGVIKYNGHAWNGVSIDNKWYLLDATWASGSVNGNIFSKQYNDFYFLTDPVKFFNDHFPDDCTWTLLPDPPGLQQFFNSVYINQDFYSSGIISFKPAIGLIVPTAANNKVSFELETDDVIKRLDIDEYPLDTIRHDAANEALFYRELKKPHIPRLTIEGNKIYLHHYSLSCKARQIFIYYNGKLVLCYGIKRDK